MNCSVHTPLLCMWHHNAQNTQLFGAAKCSHALSVLPVQIGDNCVTANADGNCTECFFGETRLECCAELHLCAKLHLFNVAQSNKAIRGRRRMARNSLACYEGSLLFHAHTCCSAGWAARMSHRWPAPPPCAPLLRLRQCRQAMWSWMAPARSATLVTTARNVTPPISR